MLTRILIHNYNCFVDFKLELPKRLLLAGSNGSGKTSLWEVLAGLQDVVVRGAEASSAFPTRTLTRWLKGSPVQRFELDVQLDGGLYHYELEILHEPKRRLASIHRELLTFSAKPLYESSDGEVRLYGDEPSANPSTSFPFGRKHSFLASLEPRNDNTRTIAFREALANVWLLAPSPQRLEATTADEAPWLARDGKNFASWFRGVLVERPEIGNQLLEALRPALPGLRGVAFERVSSEVRELMLTFRAAGSDYKLSAGELSDGQRTLLLLYGFLLGAVERAALVFVDEPETGLAPHEMQPWFSAMSSVLERHDGQALVFSHHPAVIDYMAAAGAARFSRPGGGAARIDAITLETTGGTSVSEWLSRPWVYEEEYEERAS